MTCAEYQRWCSPYIDALLGAAERGQFEEHLRGCDACRRSLASLQQMLGALKSLERPEVPELLPGIHERLRREPWWRLATARLSALWPAALPAHSVALAATALLVVVLVGLPRVLKRSLTEGRVPLRADALSSSLSQYEPDAQPPAEVAQRGGARESRSDMTRQEPPASTTGSYAVDRGSVPVEALEREQLHEEATAGVLNERDADKRARSDLSPSGEASGSLVGELGRTDEEQRLASVASPPTPVAHSTLFRAVAAREPVDRVATGGKLALTERAPEPAAASPTRGMAMNGAVAIGGGAATPSTADDRSHANIPQAPEAPTDAGRIAGLDFEGSAVSTPAASKEEPRSLPTEPIATPSRAPVRVQWHVPDFAAATNQIRAWVLARGGVCTVIDPRRLTVRLQAADVPVFLQQFSPPAPVSSSRPAAPSVASDAVAKMAPGSDSKWTEIAVEFILND